MVTVSLSASAVKYPNNLYRGDTENTEFKGFYRGPMLCVLSSSAVNPDGSLVKHELLCQRTALWSAIGRSRALFHCAGRLHPADLLLIVLRRKADMVKTCSTTPICSEW